MNTAALDPAFNVTATHVSLALRELKLPQNARVLDVGTGKGFCAIYLASHGYQVVTGEPETDQSRYANQAWDENAKIAGVSDQITFQNFDAAAMPFETASFNAVCFYGVLHHIDESLRESVFGEALRVVKKGDAVVFFEPRPEMLKKMWVTDPEHPLAAIPSRYLPQQANARKVYVEGPFMDIFFFYKN